MRLPRTSQRTRRHAPASALLACCLVAVELTAIHGRATAAPPGVRLPVEEGLSLSLRIHHENSQRLEVLDGEGRSIEKVPAQFRRLRQVTADYRIRWTRVQGKLAQAVVEVPRVLRTRIDSWTGEDLRSEQTRFLLQSSTRQPDLWEVRWKPGDFGDLFDFCERDGPRTEALRDLLAATLTELVRLYPDWTQPAVSGGGQWRERRRIQVYRNLPVDTLADLEVLELEPSPDGKPRWARIEGAIKQEIPGAPPRLRNHRGLFPGAVRWHHDLESGLPRNLTVENDIAIPIAARDLPIVETLTRRYLLIAGDPEHLEIPRPPPEDASGEGSRER